MTPILKVSSLSANTDTGVTVDTAIAAAAVMLSTFFRFLIINLLLNLCKSFCHLAFR